MNMKLHLPKSLALPHFARSSRRRPIRDWFSLLTIAFVILLASVAWNVWTFTRVTSGQLVGGTPIETQAPDISALEAVQEIFASRAAEEARYRAEYRFVDPSK
ncbi:MAG: hypothetical protein AAB892_00830 [Patescibacteria group bacterium]